jgi:hypothetical protein
MYLVLLLIVAICVSQRNRGVQKSSAAISGGLHSPRQTMALGGMNLQGNEFDNGTTVPILNSQWSGYDPGPGNIVFAVQGGEDGQNPSQPPVTFPNSNVTTLPRFTLMGGGDPTRPPVVPVQVNTINDKVRR